MELLYLIDNTEGISYPRCICPTGKSTGGYIFCAAYISKNKVNLISKKIRNELVTDANPDYNFNQKCNVSDINILQENLSNLSNLKITRKFRTFMMVSIIRKQKKYLLII